MSNLTKLPLEDWFETTLSQSWDWQLGAINVNATPNFTFPAGVTTYIVVSPWKTNMQVAEINAYNGWLKTITASNITLEKGAWVNSTAQIHTVGSKVIISDNYQFWADIQTAINSKLDNDWGNSTTTWDLQVGGSNFRIRKDGSDMKFTDDNNAEVSLSTLSAAAWVDKKVTISAWDTTTGVLEDKLTAWDWISLTKVNPWGNESLDIDIDLITTNGLKITTGQLDIEPATNAQIGTQRISTDAESDTWALENVSINPKQLKDRQFTTTEWQIITRWQDAATATIPYPHSLWVTPKSIRFDMFKWTNVTCHWVYDWINNSLIMPESTTTNITSITHSIRSATGSSHQLWAVTAVTDTDFSITWTAVSSPSSWAIAILATLSI